MNKILHFKHWQVFLLLFVLPFVFQMATTVVAVSNQDPSSLLLTTSLGTLLYAAMFLSWFWALARIFIRSCPHLFR